MRIKDILSPDSMIMELKAKNRLRTKKMPLKKWLTLK